MCEIRISIFGTRNPVWSHRNRVPARCEENKGCRRTRIVHEVRVVYEVRGEQGLPSNYLGGLAKDVYSVFQSKENGTLHPGGVTSNGSDSYEKRLQRLNDVMERVGTNGQAVNRVRGEQWLPSNAF